MIPVVLARALADETRWRIANLVEREALCVCELADILDVPQSTLSSHLQVMRRAGVVEAERCDKWAYYRLAGAVLPLWEALAAFAEGDARTARRLAGDRRKAVARLALRGRSQCRGPRRSIPPAGATAPVIRRRQSVRIST